MKPLTVNSAMFFIAALLFILAAFSVALGTVILPWLGVAFICLGWAL